MAGKIRVVFIIEALGRPAEHLKTVLQDLVSKFKQEKAVSLISEKVMDAKPVPEQENLFSSFVELEFETEVHALMLLVFGYMPSHIEIITPEEIKIDNTSFNVFMNELARKLHQYDELAKAFLIEKRIMQEKIKTGEIIIKKKEDNPKETEPKEKKTRKTKKNKKK